MRKSDLRQKSGNRLGLPPADLQRHHSTLSKEARHASRDRPIGFETVVATVKRCDRIVASPRAQASECRLSILGRVGDHDVEGRR